MVMDRATFLIPGNQRPVETHQLDAAQSTHHEHGPTTPTPAERTTPTPAERTTPTPAKRTRPKRLKGIKYMPMPSSRISTGPSPWTAHRVAVVMLLRLRHLKKSKSKKKAKVKVGGAKKEKDSQNVVLRYEGDGSKRRTPYERFRTPYERFLRHKCRPRKPSRFFFEHQARASAEASGNNTCTRASAEASENNTTTSGSSSGDHHQ